MKELVKQKNIKALTKRIITLTEGIQDLQELLDQTIKAKEALEKIKTKG